MIIQSAIKAFISGCQNLYNDEIIPNDASSDELGWITRDGHIELSYGRQAIGGYGLVGQIYGEWTAYRADGISVRYRKANGAIQYLSGSSWVNVITGLTATADYIAANYSSLAGTFVYFFGVDGIYKICTANPTNYTALYDSTKNFKGYAFIDQGRSILWGRKEDPTGLYGSHIDPQNSTVYTSVTSESVGTSGVLAFKSGHDTRTCFAVQITVTSTSEIYTDNFNGVLTGSLGGTGSINYMTGAYSISAATGGSANYQWEDSNIGGVTDFTKSATRLAGEGFVERQDIGGDAIMVVIPFAGSYFSLKRHSCYKFTLDTTDEAPTNTIFRTDIGVSSLRSAVASSLGILYMNTANASKPRLEIMVQNPQGDNFVTKQLFTNFAFEDYDYSDALLYNWDKYLVIGCKSNGNLQNDRMLLANIIQKTMDIGYYGIRCATQINGTLYGGDTVSQTTYELFTGFDDNGTQITNFWQGNGFTLSNFKSKSLALRFIENTLKKLKKIRFKGLIDPAQILQVYIAYDDGDFQLVGTILGNADYVDYTTSYAIGTTFIGQANMGGGDSVNVYGYYMEIKLKTPKFRKRMVKIVATGFGFASVEAITDWDYWLYEDRIPANYRLKQNVGLAGTPVDLPNPQF